MSSGYEIIIDSQYEYLKKANILGPVKISVVIPTYKRGNLIKDSLNSVLYQAENETIEIVVLSNDPEDEMDYLLDNYGRFNNLSIIRNKTNLGMCGNINKCIVVAQGEYVAYLHDDDMVTTGYINEVIKYIERYPNVDCFIPMRYVLNSDSKWGKSRQIKNFVKYIISCIFLPLRVFKDDVYRYNVKDIYRTGRNCFSAPTCGTVFRKKAVEDFGGFDPKWRYAFDFIFYEQFVRDHQILLIKKPLGIYRMIDSASNEGQVQLEFFQAQKYALEKNMSISIVNENYYEYLHLFYMGLSNEARILIDLQFGELMQKWRPLSYYLLRIRTELFYFTSGIETSKYLSKRKRKELGL